MPDILEFQGDYRWLSNFWPAKVHLDGHEYRTVEHAYQAAKTTNPLARQTIRNTFAPGDTKRLGRALVMRPDWEQVKVGIMAALVHEKFNTNPELKRKILATGTCQIVEGNYWHDNFWGQCLCAKCKGKGQNTLGKILMSYRQRERHIDG